MRGHLWWLTCSGCGRRVVNSLECIGKESVSAAPAAAGLPGPGSCPACYISKVQRTRM
jgi:hypothetical protein